MCAVRSHATSPKKTHRWIRFVATCLAAMGIISLISGCTGPSGLPAHLPVLHEPGVTPFSNASSIQLPDFPVSLAAYTPSQGTSNILISEDHLYAIPIAPKASPRIIRNEGCSYDPGTVVSQPNQWIVCGASDGIEIYSLDSNQAKTYLILPSDAQGLGSPSWAPDGQFLTFLTFTDAPNDHCHLWIYHLDTTLANDVSLPLVAQMTLPFEVRDCLSVSWSPSGEYLAVEGQTSKQGGMPENWLIRTKSMLDQLARHVATPQISLGDVVKLPDSLSTIWEPHSSWLLAFDQQGIGEYNVVTGQTRHLFKIPQYRICAWTWTPDARFLVFAYCDPGDAEYIGPPAQLYVYTPGNS